MIKQNLVTNNTYTLKDPDHDEIKDGYQLRWVGKNYAKLQENLLPETVIVPDSAHNSQESNKDSQNLFLTGDNLEVLKHLEHAYTGKVDMIYIDPPYNTGSDGFVYNDDFRFTDDQLRDTLGLTDDEVKRIKNIYGKSSHSAWLTFMYPRLKIAKKLLKDSGVIFVSINDNEQANLKILMDEVFNEGNFIGEFIWKNKLGGGNDSSVLVSEHEYILSYAKQIKSIQKFTLPNQDNGKYLYEDEYVSTRGKYAIEALYRSSIQYSDSLFYPIDAPDGTKIYPNESDKSSNRHIWRWSPSTFDKKVKEGRVLFKKTKNGWRVFSKQYFLEDDDGEPRVLSARTILDFIGNRQGTELLKSLFDGKKIFDGPKPIDLISKLRTA